MGMFDWLFKPTKGDVTQTTSTQLGPQAQQLFDASGNLIQGAAKPINPWTGPTVAGFDPLQTAGQNQVAGAAGGAVQDLANAGTTAQKHMLDLSNLDVTHNPLITNQADAIREMVTRNLNENILPAQSHGAIQTGGMFSGGNSRDAIAQGKAIGDTNLNLTNALTKLFGDAYTGEAGRMQTAQGQNAQVMANNAAPGTMMDAVGQAKQAQSQKEIDAAMAAFYLPQILPMQQAQQILAMLGMMPGATTTSHSTGTNPQAPLFTQLLGAAASGAAKGATAG